MDEGKKEICLGRVILEGVWEILEREDDRESLYQ